MALTRATDKIIANADGNLNLSGIVTASSFRGDGSQLTGVDASTLKNGSDTKAQANASGVVVTGVLTATSFRGDGSNLTNLPAGLGTALSSDQTSANNKLYYTNRVLSIGSTTTVDHPATASGAYTQYAEIQIEDNADLIIEDGDDLIPDILGLGDNGSTGAGGLGRLRVDTITNKSANGAVNFPNGLVGTSATFTGVLTYEDVTNVDSVGVITARSGIDAQGDVSVADKIIHTGDTNTAIRFPAADTITAETGGSERVRIGSSGQIGIAGANYGTAGQVLTSGGSGGAVSWSTINSSSDAISEGDTKAEVVDTGSDGHFKVITENTERLRITNNGYVGINTNNPASLLHTSSSGDHVITHQTTTSGADIRLNFRNNSGTDAGGIHYLLNGNALKFIANSSERFRISNTTFRSVGHASNMTAKGISLEESSVGGRLYIGRTNADYVAEWYYNGSRVGGININQYGTGYQQSSDYRLKENVVAISDGITRIKTLKPSRFNFKVDKDTIVDGFLAHEVTPTVPEATTGTKDEVDENNEPVYQGIDHSKLVPLLTAALQEAITKIETLETKVAALEVAL